MKAKDLLRVAIPGLVILVAGGLACSWWHPWTAADGGPEDPAVRDVERAGGVCRRASAVRRGDPVPDYARGVEGDPVVEVELGAGAVVFRQGARANTPRTREHVTDAAVANIHLLPALRVLSLRDTGVTDEGLRSVAALVRLTRLDLLQSGVTDAGMKHLAGFEELWDLDLASTGVTSEGMKDVAKIRSLTQLDLSWTEVGDAGLAELTALPRLHTLNLWGARQVTDAGVEHMIRIRTLSHLDLKGTALTDEGAKRLTKLPSLRYLSLPTPKVSEEAAREVKRALPECSVYLDYADVR